MSERLPELVLERYVLGELDGRERAEIEARLEREPELAGRLAALRRSNDEVLAALPAAEVAAEVARRAHLERAAERERMRTSRGRWLGGGAVFAAGVAALLLLVVFPRGEAPLRRTPAAATEDGERAKGDPRLFVHVKRDGRVVELGHGASARAGDLVQLSYAAAGATHGAILSIDGGGAVSLHYPEQVDGATALDHGGTIALPHSYELDDAPRFERFLFLTSPNAIDVADLLDRAGALAHQGDDARDRPLPVPDHLRQTSLLVLKESSR
jgi:hypothetical protein